MRGLGIILRSIGLALPSVMRATSLALVVTAVWSVMAVELFRNKDLYQTQFGHFGTAMLTFFSIATFDSWVHDLIREVTAEFGVSYFMFFACYAFFCGILLT